MLPVEPTNTIADVLSQYYRCPEFLTGLSIKGELSEQSGFFRWGEHIVYGRCSGQKPANSPTGRLYDVLQDTSAEAGTARLPFDPAEVIDSLHYERYRQNRPKQVHSAIAKLYYMVRPLMPVEVRKHLQKVHLNGWRDIPFLSGRSTEQRTK